jgi:hypothetical protein
MITILECEKRTIIQLDESGFQSSTGKLRGWTHPTRYKDLALQQIFKTVSLISAISDKGDHWFSLVSGTNNAATFLHSLKWLAEELERRDSAWRNTTVIVMDNARIHQARDAKELIANVRMLLIYSGPA